MDHNVLLEGIEVETNELKETTKTENQHVCSRCSKTFVSSNGLKQHLEICRLNHEITVSESVNTLNTVKSTTNYNTTTRNKHNEVAIPSKVDIPEDPLSIKVKPENYSDELFTTSSKTHSDDEQLTDEIIISSETLMTVAGHDIRKAEMIKNLANIEIDAVAMETKDICFCCDESYDTFHLGQIQCSHCRKSFKSQMSYERHIFITHSEFEDYPCNICNAKMRSETLLKLHAEQHTNRGTPFACKDCGKEFKREYDWRRHRMYSVCGKSDKDAFSCKTCNKKFNYLPSLREHMKKNCGTTVSNKPRHKCTICEKTFSSLCDLEVHATVHSEERPFECDVCGKKFKRLRLLRNHRILHTDERPFICEVCSATFKTKRLKDRHMRRHTSEPVHPCDECGRKFFQMSELRTHLKQHIKPYECDFCDEKFKSETQLKRHLKRIHRRRKASINKNEPLKKHKREIKKIHTNEDERVAIACKLEEDSSYENEFITNDEIVISSKVYKLEDDSSNENECTTNDDHLTTHTMPAQISSKTQETHRQPLPGYDLRKAEMLKNLDQIETDAINMESRDICFCCNESYNACHSGHIKCADCRKSFKSEISYERHIFIVHSEFHNHPCTICNAKLRSDNLLKLHIEQHQNRGKPFSCKVCGNEFSREYDWTYHQRYTVCGQGDTDAFKCKLCNKKFKYSHNLRKHMQKHLGIRSPNKSKHICPICEKTFNYLSDLKAHATVHSEERPFKCDLCGKKFKRLRFLRSHRLHHTDERPFSCKVCNRSFKVKYERDRHMKRHTDEQPVHNCDECGIRFFKLSELKLHYKKTHVNAYVCAVCNKKFKTEKTLERHAKCIHSIAQIDTHEKENAGSPINCNIEEDLPIVNEFITNDEVGVPSKVYELEDDSSNEMKFSIDIVEDDGGAHIQEFNFLEVPCTSSNINSDGGQESTANTIQIAPETQTNPLAINQIGKEDMLNNVEKIEEAAIIMEKQGVCFCCNESYLTCHFGIVKCSDCLKSFKSKISYQRHTFIIHSELNDFPCTICNAKMRSENLLKLHMDQHQKRGMLYACKVCGKDFALISNWKFHQKYSVCGQSDADAFKCKVCNRKFIYSINLRTHMRKHFGTQASKKRKYMCQICKKTFIRLYGLKKHVAAHTEKGPVELCVKKFNRSTYSRELRKFHFDEKPYICQWCNRSFRMKYQRDRHMKRHTDEPVHICDECGKGFVILYELKTHQTRTHGTPYECNVCNEKFNTEQKLKLHTECVHTSNNKKIDANDDEEVAWIHKSSKLEADLLKDNELFTNNEVSSSQNKHKLADDLSNAKDIVDGAHVQEKELHKCPICMKTFSNLKVHAVTHSEEHPFECGSCDRKFKRKGDLRRHRIIHTNQRPHICKFCCRSFKMKFQRDLHMKRHTEQPVHVCDVCGKGFVILYELKSHQKRIHLKTYECDVCNEKFKTAQTLEVHTECVHNNKKIDANDDEVATSPKSSNLEADSSIDNELITNDEVSTTQETHKAEDSVSNAKGIIDGDDGAHLQEKKLHMCPICKKTFSNLKVHAVTHSEEHPFECGSCDRKFKRKGDLRRHRIIHSNQRPHTCNLCSRSFRRKFQRDLHMKRHTGQPIHVCDECGKAFVILYELKSHQKRMHGKPYECDFCNEEFNTEKTLKLHTECVHTTEKILTIDDGNVADSNDKVSISPKVHKLENDLSNVIDIVDGARVQEKELHMCPICKKRVINLKVHAIVHSEERPFKCSSCDKKFKRIADLRTHRITHNNQKPHNCKLCNLSFRMKYQRDRHMKRHTDEKLHVCDECGKGFVLLYELNTHYTRAHGKPFACDVCNEKFKTKKTLESHKEMHRSSGGGERGKSTTQYSTKRNDCVLCDKNFDNSTSLQSHLLIDHDTDPEDYID